MIHVHRASRRERGHAARAAVAEGHPVGSHGRGSQQAGGGGRGSHPNLIRATLNGREFLTLIFLSTGLCAVCLLFFSSALLTELSCMTLTGHMPYIPYTHTHTHTHTGVPTRSLSFFINPHIRRLLSSACGRTNLVPQGVSPFPGAQAEVHFTKKVLSRGLGYPLATICYINFTR